MNTDDSCEYSTGETADEDKDQDSLLMLLNRGLCGQTDQDSDMQKSIFNMCMLQPGV